MTEESSSEPEWEEYQGTLTLPGETEPRNVSVNLNNEAQAAKVHFETPAAGSADWEGSKVQMARRLKYHEVVFSTVGLPKGSVEITWKCNIGFEDGTLAGVLVVRPNEERVSGEKGFVLVRSG